MPGLRRRSQLRSERQELEKKTRRNTAERAELKASVWDLRLKGVAFKDIADSQRPVVQHRHSPPRSPPPTRTSPRTAGPPVWC